MLHAVAEFAFVKRAARARFIANGHTKRADGAAYLEQVVLPLLKKLGGLTHEDQCAEFRLVVGEVDAIIFAIFDQSVCS